MEYMLRMNFGAGNLRADQSLANGIMCSECTLVLGVYAQIKLELIKSMLRMNFSAGSLCKD